MKKHDYIQIEAGQRFRNFEHWSGMVDVTYAVSPDGEEWELTSGEKVAYEEACEVEDDRERENAVSKIEDDVLKRVNSGDAEPFTEESF